MSSLLKTSFWYEWGNILALSAHEPCNITKYWGPIWKILFCFSSYFKISFLILRENDTSNPNYYYFHQEHCGWLRKQGGRHRSLRSRWFEIKGDQLYYYRDNNVSRLLTSRTHIELKDWPPTQWAIPLTKWSIDYPMDYSTDHLIQWY